ncbi:unnamed protein product [Vitrella brassicaformis CCMP3155]|uniref:TLDc domain-containing protein n=1 Tax=Vitrella brassicaformis (strain CCMP3155) TaxID=1169540 RepID=A0A0G4G6W2_VITBC|nr:unnamed protein product [Vitrella brassicaformis CCMP3155]|eukprot:CEM24453.1 unnamed protein product [Vitrella brassicaformis CCMP3155]
MNGTHLSMRRVDLIGGHAHHKRKTVKATGPEQCVEQLLRCVGDKQRLLFVIRKDHYVFGAFLSAGLEPPDHPTWSNLNEYRCDVWHLCGGRGGWGGGSKEEAIRHANTHNKVFAPAALQAAGIDAPHVYELTFIPVYIDCNEKTCLTETPEFKYFPPDSLHCPFIRDFFDFVGGDVYVKTS